MKKNILTLLLVLAGGFTYAQNFNKSVNNMRSVSTINNLDTVYFNVAQSVYQSNYVEFQVYFRSDDTVNALDFSFKFDTLCFRFDSIIRIPNYLTFSDNYDSSSGTVFFTSYALQRITNDTPLVKVRLYNLSGQLCRNNLNTLAAYLNGDVCSTLVTNPVGCSNSCTLSIKEIGNKDRFLKIYPNPTTGLAKLAFYSSVNESAVLTVSDLTGRSIMSEPMILAVGDNIHPVDLKQLANGIYILRLKSTLSDDLIRIVKQ